MITLETLAEEKSLLEKDFTGVNNNIKKLTEDLAQMKANLNALNGAIQQVNRLINKIEVEGEEKTKAVKEMVAKG
jgi:septal ring factor EnvC (AmiA/AmiB activator)